MVIRIGLSGLIGSFSEEAALLYTKRENISFLLSYLVDMEGVLSALQEEKIDLGIFPVVNLNGGLVKSAFEAMGQYSFSLIDDLWLQVNQCLLVRSSMTFSKISSVIAHPQSFAQCKNYLQKKFQGIEHIEWGDTAKAARDLSEGQFSPTAAVIASERCAEIYGLKIMENNIQDKHPNLTGFIVVKKLEEKKPC